MNFYLLFWKSRGKTLWDIDRSEAKRSDWRRKRIRFATIDPKNSEKMAGEAGPKPPRSLSGWPRTPAEAEGRGRKYRMETSKHEGAKRPSAYEVFIQPPLESALYELYERSKVKVRSKVKDKIIRKGPFWQKNFNFFFGQFSKFCHFWPKNIEFFPTWTLQNISYRVSYERSVHPLSIGMLHTCAYITVLIFKSAYKHMFFLKT